MLSRRSYGLDSLELKALSVPSSLRFLLDVEYSIVLCVTEMGSNRQFTLHFPVFSDMFRKLLGLCATRFSLECVHKEDGSMLHGTAVMPLLRYADYLPGALHLDELLACLQAEPVSKLKRRGGDDPTTTNIFEAPFTNSEEFAADATLSDVHGLGFYLTLDYGMSLASHGHLVSIRFHEDWDHKEALREFQEFSGWDQFDLRFYDEEDKRQGGIIVMPSVIDACDLLEKYEDEDSDDEGDLLPFILRPVCPLISVPSVEDSALRKLREQHWGEIEKFWARFPRTKNTVVVYNLYDGATLAEVLSFVEGLPVTGSQMVEDESPMRRHRVYITFVDSDSARKALELDGKSTKGRSLRVQVSPPFISESRRGRPVKPKASSAASPQSQPQQHGHRNQSTFAPAAASASSNHAASASASASTSIPAASSTKQQRSATASAAPATAAATVPASSPCVQAAAAATTTSTSSAAAVAAAAISGAIRRAQQHEGGTESVGKMAAAVVHKDASAITREFSTTAQHRHLDVPAPRSKAASTETTPSLMNAGAKEFIPHFVLNANSPEFCPGNTPEYGGAAAQTHLPPPPPMMLGAAVGSGLGAGLPPPPAYRFTVTPNVVISPAPGSAVLMHNGVVLGDMPPSYNLPPVYGDLPPPPPPPPYMGA